MKILDRLPFDSQPTTVDTFVGPVAVNPLQIIVWLSIVSREEPSRPFPAILDTGANLNLVLNESHIQTWLGLQVTQFRHRAMMLIDGKKVPVREAGILLHRNIPGTNQIAQGSHELSTDGGVVVYAKSTTYPRLPILGLRALFSSNRVLINTRKRHLTVDTGGWFG